MNSMNFDLLGIDHIQLAAPPGCEKEAKKFFGDILKLKEIPKPPNLAKRGGVWFQLGDKQLHIGVQKDFSAAKKAHPAFEIRNVDNLKSQLRDNGIEVIEDDELEGANRFFTSDPFGNRLEFLEWL